jgi:hypothetical protein
MSSLKEVISEMSALCEAHKQIRTFEYGEFLEIIKSKTVEYPIVMMNVVQGPMDPSTNRDTLVIELMVMDKIYKSRENNTDVENTTRLIMRDIIGVMWHSDRWQALGEFSGVPLPQKFLEKGADVVTGWGASINFDLRLGYGYCDIPIDSGYNFGTE